MKNALGKMSEKVGKLACELNLCSFLCIIPYYSALPPHFSKQNLTDIISLLVKNASSSKGQWSLVLSQLLLNTWARGHAITSWIWSFFVCSFNIKKGGCAAGTKMCSHSDIKSTLSDIQKSPCLKQTKKNKQSHNFHPFLPPPFLCHNNPGNLYCMLYQSHICPVSSNQYHLCFSCGKREGRVILTIVHCCCRQSFFLVCLINGAIKSPFSSRKQEGHKAYFLKGHDT